MSQTPGTSEGHATRAGREARAPSPSPTAAAARNYPYRRPVTLVDKLTGKNVTGHIEQLTPRLKPFLRTPTTESTKPYDTINVVFNPHGAIVLCESLTEDTYARYKGCGTALLETSIRLSLANGLDGKVRYESPDPRFSAFLARMGFRYVASAEHDAYRNLRPTLTLPNHLPPKLGDLERGRPRALSSLARFRFLCGLVNLAHSRRDSF